MKKRIITVLITILTVIPLVLITPKANTTQTSTHTVTSYGDYTFQQGTSDSTFDFELPVGGNGSFPINVTFNSGSWMTLDYQFKDKYSGTMKFTVTSSADWTLNSSNVYWSVSAEGVESTCYISATTTMNSVSRTKTFSIIFQNATSIHFSVAAPNNLNFFNSSQSITISNASFTSQPDMHDIYSEIDHIGSQFDFYIPGMSTNLSNIATDTSTMASDIAIIKGYLDGLEGYTDQLEPLLNQLININKIGTYPLWQQNFLFWANNYGGLTFDSNLPYFNYYVSNNRGAFYNPYRLKVANGKTLSFIFYSTSNISTSNITMYGSHASDLVLTSGVSYYVPNYPLYLYRFDFKNNYAGSNFFTIEFDRDMVIYPIYLGGNDLIPDDVHTLLGTDYNNTYTRLLQSINNGIGALSDDYDTSTYDNYEQTLDGLNDGLRGRFDNVDNNMQINVDTLFTPSGTAGSDGSVFEKFHFNVINTFMSDVVNNIFTTFPAIKYILIFALLLLVIGVMI